MYTTIIFVIIIFIILGVFWYIIQQEKELKKTALPININTPSKKSFVQKEIFIEGIKKLSISNKDFKALRDELHTKIIGMDEFINALLINFLAGGHILVEGLPGLAKTKTIHTISEMLEMNFKRIQFTPDMLPADIMGVEVFNMQTRIFDVKMGPIFTNIILADEINRTTPKVQSALLEAMQERQVSIGGKTHKLPHPFFVLATQNPLEHEGTYPLPEAQIDRFLFKILVDYPSLQEEIEIINTVEGEHIKEKPAHHILTAHNFERIQKEVAHITVSDTVKEYIAKIISATRKKDSRIIYGSSPRGSLALLFGSKALAYLQGRDYVTHEDIQRLVLNSLRHRIVLDYEAKANGWTEDSVLCDLVQGIEF